MLLEIARNLLLRPLTYRPSFWRCLRFVQSLIVPTGLPPRRQLHTMLSSTSWAPPWRWLPSRACDRVPWCWGYLCGCDCIDLGFLLLLFPYCIRRTAWSNCGERDKPPTIVVSRCRAVAAIFATHQHQTLSSFNTTSSNFTEPHCCTIDISRVQDAAIPPHPLRTEHLG